MTMDMFEFLEDVKTLKVAPKPWMADGSHKFVRVTADTLAGVVDECIAAGRYSIDLETTGLDNRVFDGETACKIVGVCLSPNGQVGYYIPVRHRKGVEHNVPWSQFKEQIQRLLASKAVAVFHKGKFDQEFLEFCGGEPLGTFDDPKKWDDTLILAYLGNPLAHQYGLKHLSKTVLGMEMIELSELFPEETRKSGELDFGSLDPSWEPVIWYGASDAICTYKLYPRMARPVLDPEDKVSDQTFIYQMEKLCVAATRWMERARIKIDTPKVQELIRIGQREMLGALEDVYAAANEAIGRDVRPGFYRLMRGEIAGAERFRFDPEQPLPFYMDRVYEAREEAARRGLDPMDGSTKSARVATVTKQLPSLNPDDKGMMQAVECPMVYDVLAPEQLGALLRECRVPGLKVTEKSGQVSTRKEELERVLEEAGDRFPFAGKVKRFREIQKALGTYLISALEDVAPDGTLKAQFNGHKIETGRFNCESSKDPKKDGGARFAFHSTPAMYDPDRPECMTRVREVIVARDGKFIVAIDFSGVELRIVTNFSLEPKWLREFFHCSTCDHMFPSGDGQSTPMPPPPYCPQCGGDRIGDLHTLTGVAVYGEEATKRPDWKNLRGNAKATNFTLCYGGGGNAVVSQIGCDANEGWRIKEQFDKTYRVLAAWWKAQHKFAREHKFVTTAFGRRGLLPDIDHENKMFRSQAERNAVNMPIQGTSADITKLAMALIYQACKKRGWLDKVHLLITMHDELVFEIDRDILEEAIDLFLGIMNRNPALLGLKWPVPLTSDVEIGYSWAVPWDLKKIRHKGVCPPELDGCFKGIWAKKPAPALVVDDGPGPSLAGPPPSTKKSPEGPRVYRLKAFSLAEVEAVARMMATPGTAPLRLESPTGEDLTPMLRMVWGGDIPKVAGPA